MRKTIAAGLPLVVLSVFASLAAAEATAAPIRASLPSITETSEAIQLVAAVPMMNGYRGSTTRRSGYRQNSDGYWYPSRAFNGSAEFTGSIMRPPRQNDACHGFTPTNGSSSCNY